MKRKEYSFHAETDAEATLVQPRFDEEAKEAARPVVPLSQVRSADLHTGVRGAGAGAAARPFRNGPPRGLILALAAVTILSVVTAAALYRRVRTAAPQPAAQTVNVPSGAAEPETVDAAPEQAPKQVPEQPSPSAPREIVTEAAAEQPREAEPPRPDVSAREKPAARERKDESRRNGDEEKLAERARKDEKKEA